MENRNIYADIAKRTGGDVYIGVVGPVRTGKSTFIKKVMEELVLPNIVSEYDRQRASDEMPQSAGGKTVMTAEPKFIPDEAVSVTLNDNAKLRVKMIDCVGYLVPDALGAAENGAPRMVRTPWSEEPMEFREAAELGTRKVIREHSTIGILVTTDGTIGDFPRENYQNAEETVVAEMRAIGKPFAIVLNSAAPETESSVALAYSLEEKYGVPVALVNCMKLDAEDIKNILGMVLGEFPVREIRVSLPVWAYGLPQGHWLRESICETVKACSDDIDKTGDIAKVFTSACYNPNIREAEVENIDLGTGCAEIQLKTEESLFYRVLSELTGMEIGDEGKLMSLVSSLAETKRKYDKVSAAIADVNEKGYGIVMPEISELRLEEPEIVRQAGGYGIKLRASAKSVHMIKADIVTEINPIIGTEQQAADMIKYLSDEFAQSPGKLWESNLFGKSLYEMINEGLQDKLGNMPEESRKKLSETLERIINEGSGGLICIII